MEKIKNFFVLVWRFLANNRIVAGIIASATGVLAAVAVAAVFIINLKSGVIDADKIMASYKSASSFVISESESSEQVSSEDSLVQPIEKQINYNGKSINVAKPQVAKANSKEDAKNGSYKTEQVKAKAQNTVSSGADKTINYKKPDNSFTGGIDVSSHNGNIDWGRVKAAGVQFAMIRCGYRGYLTGKIVTDATFDYNIENAFKNGINVGLYFYSTATTETEAIEEAAYVVELIKKKEAAGVVLSFPVAYDFEEFYNKDERTRAKNLSAAQISKNTDAYLSYIKSQGYKPMLYAGKNPVGVFWQPWVVSKYDYWLAHYTEATEYTGKFFMWQYTSDGAVPGISGRVDLDICGFENNDNLPRFLVCRNSGVKAYSKPKSSATVLMTLNKDTVYLCRNTYDCDYKELKIAGKYYYVSASELTGIPFTTPQYSYKAGAGAVLYSQPFDDTYKTSITLPADSVVSIEGVWADKWAKIKYEEKIYYLKMQNLVVNDIPPETPEEQEDE